MTWLVDEETRDELTEEQVVGGFIQVEDYHYRGVLRLKGADPNDMDSLVWECDHHHTRPEYNALWSQGKKRREVWQYSANNCGKKAHETFAASKSIWAEKWGPSPDEVIGVIGMVAEQSFSEHARDDHQRLLVDGYTYKGVIEIRPGSPRKLWVKGPFNEEDLYKEGYIVLDNLLDGDGVPAFTDGLWRKRWMLAATFMVDDVWGDVFRHPSDTHELQTEDWQGPPEKLADVEEASKTPKQFRGASASRRKKVVKRFYIKVERKGGKRMFTVYDSKKDKAIDSFPHRGSATKKLEELHGDAGT